MQHLIKQMDEITRRSDDINRRMLATLADAMRSLDDGRGDWMRRFASLGKERQ